MSDAYKNFAKWYDRLIEPLNTGLRQIGLKMHPPFTGMKVLDIGCGTGAHLKYYQDADCKVYGIDLSEAMLAQAKEKLADSAELHMGDATKTPYPDKTFDLVLTTTVIHEMPQQVREAVLREVQRLLKKEGRFLLIDFHPGPIKKFKGYFAYVVITIIERLAGREHFKNSRHFLRNGGVPGLIKESTFEVDKQKIVTGGNFGLFLLKNEA